MNTGDKLKIEVGKFYKTRNGKKVEIIRNDLKNRASNLLGLIEFNDSESAEYWYESGRFLNTIEHKNDLIGEWIEPITFDWDCLPPWCNDYIAMDKDERWFAYESVPATSSVYWRNTTNHLRIPDNYDPKNFTGDWEKSLFKNPNK